MAWMALAGALLAALWLGWRLVRAARRERGRMLMKARREDERARARRVLAEGAPPLAEAGVPLAPGERAYYRTEASLLDLEEDGAFRRVARGTLVVTDRGLVFRREDGRLARTTTNEIERVDIPFSDVIAFVSFRDTVTRDEVRTYYQVPEPLVLAAHVARFTGFELMLD